MSGSSAGRTLRSKKSENGLFGNSNSVSSRFDQSVPPPVPQLSPAEPKSKRKLTLFGKRRKSGSAISTSSSPASRPSYDSSDAARKSGEPLRSTYKTLQNLANGPVAHHHVSSSQHLPSRLPPLDVSPPSLGFYNASTSPKTSPSRINAILEHQIQSKDTRTRTPIKTQPRPVITVSAPEIKENTVVDADVFASPRSAPVPPRPPRNAERDVHKTPPTPAHRTPATPLRFPIPPGEDASSMNSNTLKRPEFNSDFSFPSRSETAFSVRDRANRGASVDILSNRTPDKRTARTKIVSSPSRAKLQPELRPTLPTSCSEDIQSLHPPTVPLPAPPSTFSIDSQEQFDSLTSANSIPTIPSLNSNSSLVSVQSRTDRLAMRPRTPISSEAGEEEKQQEQIRRGRFEHVPKQSVSDLREQHLRVEMNAQRVRIDELVNKVGKIEDKQRDERVEINKRIDVLEEEAREMELEIKRLKMVVEDSNGARGCGGCSGCDGKAGFPETPGSTMDGIDGLLTTPTDLGSPSSPFEYARRLLSNTPKEKTLRRTNTMPDGFDDETGGIRPVTSSGRKGNRSSSAWMMATAGLLPKFNGGVAHGTKASARSVKGLGLDCTLQESMISEGLQASDSEGRESNTSSVPALSTGTSAGNSKSSDLSGKDMPSFSERPRGARGRGVEKNNAPNMEEILARLRSFESHSPQTMFR